MNTSRVKRGEENISWSGRRVFSSRFNRVPNYLFWFFILLFAAVLYASHIYYMNDEVSGFTRVLYLIAYFSFFSIVIVLRFGGFMRQDEILIFEDRIEVRKLKFGNFNMHTKQYIPMDHTVSYEMRERSVIIRWGQDNTYILKMIFPTRWLKKDVDTMCRSFDLVIPKDRRHNRVHRGRRPIR